MKERCFTEVKGLHTFFEEWFNGTRPHDDVSFARFANVMHEDFAIISPNGNRTAQADLLTSLRQAYGVHGENPIRIWVDDLQYQPLNELWALVTYEEWQTVGERTTVRISTALFQQRADDVMWHHVHETWRTPNFDEVMQVATLMSQCDCTWAIAGGWAIDLWLNRVTRRHEDVDIFVFRDEQLQVQQLLQQQGWQLEKAAAGKLTPWQSDEFVELPIHVIWCRQATAVPNFIELVLNERDDAHFYFRRDRRIKRPLAYTVLSTKQHIPILAPEIALLYKSKRPDTDKNRADFLSVLPALNREQVVWLRSSLLTLYGQHAWLSLLGE